MELTSAANIPYKSGSQRNITKSASTIQEEVESFNGSGGVGGYVHSVVHVKPDTEHLKSAIYKYGAVSVAIDASNSVFKTYDGSYVWGYNSGECKNALEDVNHAVLAVGFGEATAPDGSAIPYFIVKNSWGVDWGSEGYGAIFAGNETTPTGGCGILTDATAVSGWRGGDYSICKSNCPPTEDECSYSYYDALDGKNDFMNPTTCGS